MMAKLKYRRWVLTFAVVLATLTAGCPSSDPGTSIMYSGDMTISNDKLQMHGEIVDDRISDQQHDNVTIYFYNENKSLISKNELGTLAGDINVSTTVTPVPTYVVIDSSDFWSLDKVAVTYFVREGDIMERRYATNRSELPVVPEE